LSIYEETIGPNHPEITQCLNNAAMLYGKLGKYQEAIELLQRATIILEQNPETKQIDNMTQIFENLALLHKDHEQTDNAEQVWKKALSRRIRQDLNLDDDLEPIPEPMLQALKDHQDHETFLASLPYQERGKYEKIGITILEAFQALDTAVEAFAKGDHTQSQKIETILFYLSAKLPGIQFLSNHDESSSTLDTIPMGKVWLDMDTIGKLQQDFKETK